MTTKPWYELRPDLVEEIRTDLGANYPSLHLFIEPGRRAEVRGTFPVLGERGKVLDRFQVTIALPRRFPRDLPITWETGGRIPWTPERHVNKEDGTACVLLPDERWRVFPVGSPFIGFIRGPLHSFFLSQVAFETTGEWPFGEWGHGACGILEHYFALVQTRDPYVVLRYLAVLKRGKIKAHRRCPCGSGKSIRDCCRDKLEELRHKIDPATASASYRQVDTEILTKRVEESPRTGGTLMAFAGRAVGIAR